MACGNVFERLFVLWRALLRQPRALDELVRDTLERRDDDNGWAAVGRIEDDSSDVTHPIGRRERRAAELQNPHCSEIEQLRATARLVLPR